MRQTTHILIDTTFITKALYITIKRSYIECPHNIIIPCYDDTKSMSIIQKTTLRHSTYTVQI